MKLEVNMWLQDELCSHAFEMAKIKANKFRRSGTKLTAAMKFEVCGRGPSGYSRDSVEPDYGTFVFAVFKDNPEYYEVTDSDFLGKIELSVQEVLSDYVGINELKRTLRDEFKDELRSMQEEINNLYYETMNR